jgi:CIC family chloride channel protein
VLTPLLKFKIRIQRLFRATEGPAILPWASVIGVAGALATIAFRDALRWAERLLGGGGSLVELAEILPWQVRIALPALGGAVAGLFLLWAARQRSTTPSDYMEAIAGDSRISIRQTLLHNASSLCTIASGGSIGREGSMVQLSAMCASVIGRITHFDPVRLRLLVACGAAAGVTAAYNAPIASAFFVSEIVLGAVAMDSFGPVLVASVAANITMREFPGYHPTYEMPAMPSIAGAEVMVFVGLGVVAGLLAPQFLRLLETSKRQFQRTDIPLPFRLALGGLVVGLLSVEIPQVWGNGYSVVNSLLHVPWVWSAVLILLVCKIVATVATVGSGAVGGVFTPTLFVGAAVGYLFGVGMHGLWPDGISAPFIYAVVGMGAFLAAATSAPLMAMLMIFEMTLSYQVMLPLMLACVVAYYVARGIDGGVMYEITLKHIKEEKAKSRLRATQMRDLIQSAETVLPLTATLDEMMQMFLAFPVKYIYVVDDRHRYQGVVALRDLTSSLAGRENSSTGLAKDFLRHDVLEVLTPDMSLSEGLRCFLVHRGERLPIVKDFHDPELLGAVFKTSLLDAYVRLNQ